MDENSGQTGLSAARTEWLKGRRGESGSVAAAATGVGAVELSGGESCMPRVGDLPIRAVPIIPAHLTMAAARKVAELKRASVLFVERDGRLMGTLDEHALVEAPDEAEVAHCLRAMESASVRRRRRSVPRSSSSARGRRRCRSWPVHFSSARFRGQTSSARCEATGCRSAASASPRCAQRPDPFLWGLLLKAREAQPKDPVALLYNTLDVFLPA